MSYEDRYISKTNNGGYAVNKNVEGTSLYFGTYDTLRDAKFARDYFEGNKWDTNKKEDLFNLIPKQELRKISRHIYKDEDKYNIQKQINHKNIYFGRYDTLEDALLARQYFEEHNWNHEDVKKMNMAKPYKSKHRFIKKTPTGYQLKRTINGKTIYFGVYNTLKEAVTAREYFENNNWNVEERFKFTKPRKQPKEIDLNKPYFQSMRLV